VPRRLRVVREVLPTEVGQQDGLAYSLWLPAEPRGGVVILHGADSCKENHHDFARVVLPSNLAAVAFDQRGHGDSAGPLDGRVLRDVATMATLLRSRIDDPAAPIALRGSSMGGCIAILAADAVDARAVVAICPAPVEGLREGIHSGRLHFEVDVPALDALLATADLEAAVASMRAPLLLMHAQGDEQVPVEHSRALAKHARSDGSRMIEMRGGHHRSIQHDAELQAVSLHFIERAFAAG
jgi:uncharacterized protein